MVTTPAGDPVAMVHCNNCTSDIDAWIRLFDEAATALGAVYDERTLYQTLYKKALEGAPDCGGLMTFNYLSGEPVTGLDEGRPLFLRKPSASFTLANTMRAHITSALLRWHRHGHSRRGARGARRDDRPRRILQSGKNRTDDHVRRARHSGHRNGDGGRRRPLGHGGAGGVSAAGKRTVARRIPQRVRVRRRKERNFSQARRRWRGSHPLWRTTNAASRWNARRCSHSTNN